MSRALDRAHVQALDGEFAPAEVDADEDSDEELDGVEADEFDRSFLRLFPQVAIVSSADADHLDIYGDHEALVQSFKDFIKQINKDGTLIIHESVDELLTRDTHVKKSTYSMSRGQFFAVQRDRIAIELFHPNIRPGRSRIQKASHHRHGRAIVRRNWPFAARASDRKTAFQQGGNSVEAFVRAQLGRTTAFVKNQPEIWI